MATHEPPEPETRAGTEAAIRQVMAEAGAEEAGRQDTHTPAGGSDPGLELADAGPGQLAGMGMSADTEVPARGPLTPYPQAARP